MSQIEMSEELVRQVREKTGRADLEQGVWQLLYQGRGRYAGGDAGDSSSLES